MTPKQTVRALMDHQAFVMQVHGGVSRIFAEIARHFPDDAPELTVFGGVHVNEYLQTLQSEKTVQTVGFRIPHRIGKQRLLLPCDKVLLSLFCAAHCPDLIHYTYFHRTQPRRRNIREIMTVHDMTYELFPEFFRPDDPTAAQKRRMAEEVDGIICISENTKKDLLKFCDVPEERVRVIPHGNPMEDVTAVRPAKKCPPFFLFVGRRPRYKNFTVLLDAMASSVRCVGFEVVAFGGGPFTGEEREEIQSRGLSGRVFQMTGPDEVLAGLYETAQALVYPSRYEGFGLPPLEAMSRGCPVIVSQGSSLPEVVGEAGLYFDPDDSVQLRDCLESVFDPAARRQWVDKGLVQAKLFSWARCARATADFYQDVLAMPVRENKQCVSL